MAIPHALSLNRSSPHFFRYPSISQPSFANSQQPDLEGLKLYRRAVSVSVSIRAVSVPVDTVSTATWCSPRHEVLAYNNSIVQKDTKKKTSLDALNCAHLMHVPTLARARGLLPQRRFNHTIKPPSNQKWKASQRSSLRHQKRLPPLLTERAPRTAPSTMKPPLTLESHKCLVIMTTCATV